MPSSEMFPGAPSEVWFDAAPAECSGVDPSSDLPEEGMCGEPDLVVLADPGPDFHPYNAPLQILEMLERRRRGADADRMRFLAAALDRTLERSESITGSVASSRELAYRSLRAEFAVGLSMSEYLVEQELTLAHKLRHDYQETFRALERGAISLQHCRVIADAATVLGAGNGEEPARRRAGYEREALEAAVSETPNRLRPIARRIAETWADRHLDARHSEARRERRVTVVDREDGMADLMAHLPAVEAHAIHDRLTRIARAAERGERHVPERHLPTRRASDRHAPDECAPDESAPDRNAIDRHTIDRHAPDQQGAARRPDDGDESDEGTGVGMPTRSRDEVRADVFAELLLAADEHRLLAGGTAEAIRAQVQVVIPAEALPGNAVDAAGLDPAAGVCELTGYGPIGTDAARGLAAHTAHWQRATTGPDGVVLEVDRYRPTPEMRRLLRARDEHCRFPGCRVPASRCDLDHTVDAARGGATSTANLASLCRGHHTLKHHGGWSVEQDSGGVLRWTSPTGRQRIDRPPRKNGGGASMPEPAPDFEPPPRFDPRPAPGPRQVPDPRPTPGPRPTSDPWQAPGPPSAPGLRSAPAARPAPEPPPRRPSALQRLSRVRFEQANAPEVAF